MKKYACFLCLWVVLFSLNIAKMMIAIETGIKAKMMIAVEAGMEVTRNKAQNTTTKLESCALLFFGLLKSFPAVVLPSIRKSILEPNPSCDVFIHTYNLTYVPGNPRNNEIERDENYQSLEAYLLTPNVVIENLDVFREKRKNYTAIVNKHHHQGWGACCLSSENMIKQWHSIESVWELMELHAAKRRVFYKQVGLFRSDAYYVDSINISDSQAALPSFESYMGVNDRLFYGKYEYAKVWATKRFEFMPAFLKYFLNARNDGRGQALIHSNGTYDVQRAQLYMQKGGYQGFHSETYLAKLLINHSIVFEPKDICVRRVRAGGKIEFSDARGNLYWDSLNSKAQKAAKLLGFDEETWDSDSPVLVYSTPFHELAEDKREAVGYLGLRSYFA